MTATITLSRRDLHDLFVAVLPHAGTDVTLPTLNTVHLDFDGRTLLAVASDRYTLGICRHDFEEKVAEPFTALLRLADVKRALALFKPVKGWRPPVRITVEPVGPTEPPLVLIEDDLAEPELTLRLRGYDGEFFKWRAVMHGRVTSDERGTPEGFAVNGAYMARWQKAARGHQPVRVLLTGGPTKPIVVSVGEHFIGLQMPVRLDYTDEKPALVDPAWPSLLTEPAKKKVPARKPAAKKAPAKKTAARKVPAKKKAVA